MSVDVDTRPDRMKVGEVVALTECQTLGEDGPISGLWTIVHFDRQDLDASTTRDVYTVSCADRFPCTAKSMPGNNGRECRFTTLPLADRCRNCHVIVEELVDGEQLLEQVDPKAFGQYLAEERETGLQLEDELRRSGIGQPW